MMNPETPVANISLAENINHLLAKVGVNATELARRTGLPAATIKTLRHGDNLNPTLGTLLAIAKFFSVTVSQLIGEEKLCFGTQSLLSEKSIKEIPLFSWAEMRHWPEGSVKESECITVDPAEVDVDFALRVDQDGLEVFPYGAVLFIKAGATPANQDFIIIKKDEPTETILRTNITLKQFLDEGDGIYLKSLISGYPIVEYTEKHRVVGVVRAIMRVFNQSSRE